MSLEKFNTELYEKHKGEKWQIGFFSPDTKYLFIGQNPGVPNNKADEEVTNSVFVNTFTSHQLMYRDMIRKSKIGGFLNDIIKGDWDIISFTNIWKQAFDQNKVPEIVPEECKRILSEQVRMCKPRTIIALGKVAHEVLSELKIKHIHFYHPSYLWRTGQYDFWVQRYLKDLKELEKDGDLSKWV